MEETKTRFMLRVKIRFGIEIKGAVIVETNHFLTYFNKHQTCKKPWYYKFCIKYQWKTILMDNGEIFLLL